MSMMALGGGAAEGLDKLMARLMAEREQSRLEAGQQEVMRSNRAEEGLRGRDLEMRARERADTIGEMRRFHDQTEAGRQRDDVARTIEQRPIGSEVTEEEYSRERQFKTPEAAYHREAAYEPDPQQDEPGFTGPTQEAKPSLIRFRGTAKQQTDAATAKRADDRAAAAQSNDDRRYQQGEDRLDQGERRIDQGQARIDRGFAPIIIQTPNGQQVTSGDRRTIKPLKDAQGQDVAQAPTSMTRERSAAVKRVQPMIDAVVELVPRINDKAGLAAIAQGSWSKVQAAANYNDDVAEYAAVVESFTPLLARAMGHTGVLTEPDYQHSMAMLPKPRDSASLANRKLARLGKILGLDVGDEPAGDGAVPDVGGTFQGGKVLKVTPVK